jgi:hypothetical protein
MRLGWRYGSVGMVLRTLATKLFRKSDRARWTNLTNHDIAWDKRTRAIADLIPRGSHVVEFGAGRCQLRNWLPIDCTYVPSDIVSRGPDTWLCDLNLRPLPKLRRQAAVQVAVFSGVLEYVADLTSVLRWLAPKPIVSLPRTIAFLRRTRQLSGFSRPPHDFQPDGLTRSPMRSFESASNRLLIKPSTEWLSAANLTNTSTCSRGPDDLHLNGPAAPRTAR